MTNPFASGIAAAAAATPHKIAPVEMVPGLTLHIDGDFLAYYAAGNDDTLPGQARVNLLGIVETLRSRSGSEHVVVHSTVPGSNKGERYLVATVKPYQAQRKPGRKPKNHGYLQDFLLGYAGDVFRSKLWSTREADDGMAACAHHAIGAAPGYAVIATKDKDLRMVPGLHIDWDTQSLTRVPPGCYDVVGENGKQYGLKWFWLQMLMGDTADNIPGLERGVVNGKLTQIGEKRAEAMLADCLTNEAAADRVQALYITGYSDEWADRFVEQAALLWMRCGAAEAPIDDFFTHAGHSRISHALLPEVAEAVERMKDRVYLARQSLNELSNS